jgi:hypothetical protein
MPTYTYDVAADTSNGKVNPVILAQQIEDFAGGFPSGGAFGGVSTEGGVAEAEALVAGGTLVITWGSALDASDEANQNALVAAHIGIAFGNIVQRAQDNTEKTTSTGGGAPVTQVELATVAPPPGQYLVALSCEIRLEGPSPGTGVRGVGLYNGSESSQDNWDLEVWHTYSASAIKTIKAGEAPVITLQFHRVGVVANVQCRRAHVSISQQSD